MASIFTTGTINDVNAGAVGLAMAEKLRDDLIAHAAWDLVEEFTPASGLVRWYVFKCLASESGLSADFYVVVGRTIGSGELRAFICEGYNSTTHVASYYASCQSGTSTVYDASGRQAHTYTLGTTVLSNSPVTNPVWHQWTPSGVSTKWWLIAAEDGFSVAFNGAANGFMHYGAYVPLSDVANPLPLQMVGDYTGVSGASITRNPCLAGLTGRGSALRLSNGGQGLSTTSIINLGFQGRLDYNDKLQSDQRPVAEIGMTVQEDTTGDRANGGWAVGKQKRIRVGSNPPAGFAFGDAYSLQGRLWVPYKPDDARIWDTGVAA